LEHLFLYLSASAAAFLRKIAHCSIELVKPSKVSALADVLLVPKLRRRDRLDRFFRHRRKAEARQRERVLGLGTVFRWLGEWPDDVQKFQDRAGPAVRKHKRQGVITFAFNVVELDIEAATRAMYCG
jgi:hypothetical protein